MSTIAICTPKTAAGPRCHTDRIGIAKIYSTIRIRSRRQIDRPAPSASRSFAQLRLSGTIRECLLESGGKEPWLLSRSLNWMVTEALAVADPEGLEAVVAGLEARKDTQTPTAKAGMCLRINELVQKWDFPKLECPLESTNR